MNSLERHVLSLFDLQGRVALVTGGCGHLGAAMSRALAEAGATVVVTSREGPRAADFAASLPGSNHLGLGLDVGQSDSISPAIAEIIRRVGQIDVLVNNAYSGPAPKIGEATAADFALSYQVGVTACFLLARAVADHLRLRDAPGSIINIASMYGVVASYPEVYEDFRERVSPPNYHALKGGLVHLTRHLAVYWAQDNIRVNAISPGPFPPIADSGAQADFIAKLSEKVPLGRVGNVEELKGVLLLLASDAGSYITGQNILVDGGWTAW